jgi:hypothetical protein
MLNSVISCKGAQFSTIDIKNFYLDTPMVEPKYIHIKITDIPEEFILEYSLARKEDHNGWIYLEIQYGCYGSPQAGIVANDLLCGFLEKEGYYKAATTLGLWKHKWRHVIFQSRSIHCGLLFWQAHINSSGMSVIFMQMYLGSTIGMSR